MPLTLTDVLLAPDTQPQLISDCFALIEQELADKSGASGAALRLAYKTVANFKPGYLRRTLEDMLPQIVAKLEPYWADFTASGGSDFGGYLAKNGEEVSESLLAVTDQMAEESGRPTIVRAYRSIRGSAIKHVEAALPRLGDLVLKYLSSGSPGTA
jgi:hypothetical protein